MAEVITLSGRDFDALLEELKQKVSKSKIPIRAHHMFCSDPNCQNHILAVGGTILRCTCGASVVEPPHSN